MKKKAFKIAYRAARCFAAGNLNSWNTTIGDLRNMTADRTIENAAMECRHAYFARDSLLTIEELRSKHREAKIFALFA